MLAAGGIVGAAELLARLGEANRASLIADDSAVAGVATQTLPQALVLLGCAAMAHVALRRWAPAADQLLLPLATLVVGVGWVLVAHLERVDLMGDMSAAVSWQHTGWVALATVAFSVSLATRWRPPTLMVAGSVAIVGLLASPVIGYGLFGVATNVVGVRPPEASLGALWFSIGELAVSSFELSVIALIVALAGWLTGGYGSLSRRAARRNVQMAGRELFDLVAAAAVVFVGAGAAVVLWFSRDLTAALVVLFTGTAMMAAASSNSTASTTGHERPSVLMRPPAALTLWVIALAVVAAANGALRSELTSWLDTLWGGAETEFAFALAHGSALGAGLGLGSPLVGHNESAAMLNGFAEAFGLLGVGVLATLIALVAAIALRAAGRGRDARSAITAAGVFGAIAVQPTLVLASSLGLLPPTTLSFGGIGFGPTSLLAGAIAWALLCRATEPDVSTEQPT